MTAGDVVVFLGRVGPDHEAVEDGNLGWSFELFERQLVDGKVFVEINDDGVRILDKVSALIETIRRFKTNQIRDFRLGPVWQSHFELCHTSIDVKLVVDNDRFVSQKTAKVVLDSIVCLNPE